MFYILYQVTNKVNGKIYVGVHKTKNLDDGYMGSGKIINNAIKKYGIENFTRVILEQFDDSIAMYAREKEVVNEEFLARDDTYNLRRGGSGGFDWINKTATSADKAKGGFATNGKGARICIEKKIGMFSGKYSGFKSKEQQQNAIEAARSPEAKAKAKETYARTGHCKGEKNSQFGTAWINKPGEKARKCKLEQLPEFISLGWHRGRKAAITA